MNRRKRVLRSVPPPCDVRRWLAEAIREAALLRSLLRVADRKAALRRPAGAPRKEALA